MKADKLFFTVLDQSTSEELRVELHTFEPDPQTTQYADCVVVNTTMQGAIVDCQQIGELGALFLALAGDFDMDSVVELLDGYGATMGDMERLAHRLRELAHVVEGHTL